MLHTNTVEENTLELLKNISSDSGFSNFYAAMKLNAIVNRGAKKDFVDIFFLLRDYSLNQLITFHNRKYPNQNELLVLKSLMYFADADLELEPLMIEKCRWDEIKESVRGQVNNYIKET